MARESLGRLWLSGDFGDDVLWFFNEPDARVARGG